MDDWFDDYDDDYREYNDDPVHDMYVDDFYAETDTYEQAEWSHSRPASWRPSSSPSPAPVRNSDPVGDFLRWEVELAAIRAFLAPIEEKMQQNPKLRTDRKFLEKVETKRKEASRLEAKIAKAHDRRCEDLKQTDKAILATCGGILILALLILALV